MITHCPSCQTIYSVTADELRIGRGRAKCSQCGAVFDVLDHLREEIIPLLTLNEPAQPDESTGRRDDGATERDQPAVEDEPFIKAPQHEFPPQPDTLTATSLYEVADADTDWREAARPIWEITGELAGGYDDEIDSHRIKRRRFWLWIPLIFLAALALPVQWIYWQYPAWVQNPALRPWLDPACVKIQSVITGSCQLPPLQDLTRLRLTHAALTSAPQQPGKLSFAARLENQAAFSQPQPTLRLILEDRFGEALTTQVYTPAQYRTDPALADTLLPPGIAVTITLELTDPGDTVVGYRYDLLSTP